LPLIENTDGVIFVAEDNNKIIGYLAGDIKNATSWRKKMKIVEGESMFVLPEYRSQGIGSKLFEEFFKWAKEKGATRVSLTASFANVKAIKFYKKLGFKEYDLVLEKEL
jgi:GNAT superfamily N-acetyltransferase